MKLQILPTKNTPFINVDLNSKLFEMKGRSSPQSAVNFYYPILDSLKRTIHETDNFSLNFNLEYFNTSSSKCIFDILKVAKTASNQGHKIEVNWRYEDWDDDMKEAGEDYEDILGIAFNYIEVN